MLIQLKGIILSLFLMNSQLTHAEVFRLVDKQGRVQFSDIPNLEKKTKNDNLPNTKTVSQPSNQYADVIGHKKISNKEPKDLNAIAKKMKKERLVREKSKKKREKNRKAKLKKHQKQLAAAKKKKLACKKAKENEDLAFRKRTQQQGLLKMRKALANYEKKREARRKKCSR